MRIAVLLICLCVFLLKGVEPAHAVAASYNASYSHDLFRPSQPAGSLTAFDRVPSIINGGSHDQREYLAIDDAEDEDSNNSFARKFKWLTRYKSETFCQPLSVYFINRSKAAPLYYGRVSPKYIQQRVLRV